MLPGYFCNTRQCDFYGKVAKSYCDGHKLGGIKDGLGKKLLYHPFFSPNLWPPQQDLVTLP